MDYKILLVCAGGMSTGLLMKKMETYWQQQGHTLKITACGVGEFMDYEKDYDVIMVGPQISYRLKDIKKAGKPCDCIPSFDYAVANCPNIIKLANKLYKQLG